MKPNAEQSVSGWMNFSSNPPHAAVRRLFSFASVAFAVCLTSGCIVAERRPRRVPAAEAPPPHETVVVHEGPRTEVIVVRDAPPPLRREIIVERDRPSPRHIWIAGYWGWLEGRHVWLPGHWELPPRPQAVWVEPRWERRGNGYVLVEGIWR